jgi:hypothetical protein
MARTSGEETSAGHLQQGPVDAFDIHLRSPRISADCRDRRARAVGGITRHRGSWNARCCASDEAARRPSVSIYHRDRTCRTRHLRRPTRRACAGGDEESRCDHRSDCDRSSMSTACFAPQWSCHGWRSLNPVSPCHCLQACGPQCRSGATHSEMEDCKDYRAARSQTVKWQHTSKSLCLTCTRSFTEKLRLVVIKRCATCCPTVRLCGFAAEGRHRRGRQRPSTR